ncbi:hypothetical protein ACFU51_14720 [Streptomyces sp. NPDC057430]|uniref:hypothetical protein n=1 Tax=Streptomyces sp. NPDC057430 TaxID=3346131 RepID=UPI0036CDABD1
MRTRLLAAVRALLTDPSLAGVPDVGRLAAVVLYAKSRAPQGRPEDNTTSTWGPELGRWMGVTESTVHHSALPSLRASGAVRTRVVTDAQGHPTGLDCLVMPLWRARRAGAGHPLALSRAELATLLRLIEALFGPGWAPKDKAPVPAGLLAGRTGRGAATDRLGLLLMVLSTNRRGWLQLCSGAVDSSRGRPAATVARLLGCTPAAGAKVLARLQEQGTVRLERQGTGSGLYGKSKVRLLTVAQAHGLSVREARKAAEAVVSELAVAACGDHESGAGTAALGNAGVPGTAAGESSGFSDLAGTAEHHASHASVVTPVASLELSGGFSGEGRGGEGRMPDRACARVDQAVHQETGALLTLVDGDGGPLRGDKPKKSPLITRKQGGARPIAFGKAEAVGTSGQGRRKSVSLPPDDLLTVLAPVRLLWERLDRPYARRLVEAAARSELARVTGFVGQADAADVLADRLSHRLEEQIRLAGPVKDPVGWIIGRGLPQRQVCGDVRCDEGLRLDTGGQCTTCEYVIGDRRDQRRQLAAAVDGEMPRASQAERQVEVERRLNEAVTAEGWAKARYRERIEAERAVRRAYVAQNRTEFGTLGEETATGVGPKPLPVLVRPAPYAIADTQQHEDQAPLVLEELTREQVLDWRDRAAADHQVVFDHIERYGELSAKRLFTGAFVEQVQRLSRLGHLDLGYTPWAQA